jgi:hypothetical protein
MTRIAATTTLPAAPAVVFAFLADASNHHELAGRRLQLLEASGNTAEGLQGLMLLCGPLGMRRRVRTEAMWSSEPRLIAGIARLRHPTRAIIQWELDHVPEGTRLTLSATVASLGLMDRVLLYAGGRRWIKRLLQEALERLAAAPRAGARRLAPVADA